MIKMQTYRNKLSGVYRLLKVQPHIRREKATNAGLWFDKYIEDQSREDTKKRGELIEAVTVLPPPDAYRAFYERWEKTLESYGAKTRTGKVKGRMVVGLGDESVLETSITLHRTYGVPYIPGSALKGLAASYARHQLGDAWKEGSDAYTVVFGKTDDAGFITFFDAFYIPGSAMQGEGNSKREQMLFPDVITVHHPGYYQNNGNAPADWDNPNPVSFLSATGSYLIALAAPELASPQREQWIERTFSILEHALATIGIGAKTSSGYGRMILEAPAPPLPPPAPPVNPEMRTAESYRREIERMRDADVASQMPNFAQRWQKLTSREARLIVARAIVAKVKQAERETVWAERPWYKELVAFLHEVGE
jgi:CRISPR-associated protein Cmr6